MRWPIGGADNRLISGLQLRLQISRGSSTDDRRAGHLPRVGSQRSDSMRAPSLGFNVKIKLATGQARSREPVSSRASCAAIG